MTPKVFCAALDELGISAEWLARQCGRGSRTGSAWRTGNTVVPVPVAAWLLRRLAQMDLDPPPQLPPSVNLPGRKPKRGRDSLA